ncbi:hypothetical protein PILCRDRAFT_198236 [Piloderma croceum F 1598]|uniref:Uncharacterized protein n=1 Tax=Piloderma croceum (strain F 1598) TaxID=765440 RepID=A0A0C3GDP6_PILCF|nr:hypothetical protein PILCRDRAFT_198236 [Piloderma croceum F 1598]
MRRLSFDQGHFGVASNHRPPNERTHVKNMSSSNHYYDQNLLGAAPEATKAQRQEGYNVDLLNQSRSLQSKPTVLTPRSTDVETAVQHPDEKYVTAGASHTPFFQSTKGRIGILIAVIVIIGAVVGGFKWHVI